ncbi:TIR domain-containing protein [Nitrospira sp. BLG_2]|uniref:TIR domain-containing protein n=1 Tax=Nitrospira sp. BLG_2 TaxID=3397507 RepID=UPI003B99E5A6
MTSQVFISYSHEDKALYSSLCLALDGAGVLRRDVSRLSLGKPLAEGLRSAIEECDVCIFLATARSLESPWCLAELGAFWGAGKKVIVYLADPAIDETDLPPQFRGNLWTANATDLVEGIKETDTSRIRKMPNGYCVGLGPMTIKVILGRIEELDCEDEDCLVALPANEFFDDDCIHDSQSALGAFMQHHFKGQIPDIQTLVRAALANEPTKEVKKKPGVTASSYGVGKCVFLDDPLSSRLRIAMVSVTTQRAGVGLRADAAYLFNAVASLQRVMANHRLTRLYTPILGSGHGGLKGEVSLVCMLIAFGELRRKSAHNLKEVNIVVFRGKETSTPSASEVTIKRALDFASRFLAE